jgi:hypothetical protein
MKAPSRSLVCKWVVDSWKDVPSELVQNSFVTCGITTALGGSDDDKIHCFKAGQACCEGRDLLRVQQQILPVITGVTGAPVQEQEDDDQLDINEACVDTGVSDANYDSDTD